MDVFSFNSEFLSLFISLIVAGTGLKLALQEAKPESYQWGDKHFNKQKVHTAGMLVLLGVVIQTVSNTMKLLDGRQLLLDEKILAAYAFSIVVLIMKN